MLKTTKWRPDTCGCEIEYQWDDSVAQEERTHVVSTITKNCPIHDPIPTKGEHYNVVLEENQRKNKVYGKLLDLPTLTVDVVQTDGKTIKELKPSVQYNWSFDKDRNLVVDLVGVTTSDKNTLKTAVSQLFGTKVTIK